MATTDDLRSHDRVENSWYELIAGQLQALIPKVGIEAASAQLYQAYELICRTSLGCPVEPGTRSSRLNLDGTPIQFALALGHPTVPLQFLSEAGNPDMSHSEARIFIDETVRALVSIAAIERRFGFHSEADSQGLRGGRSRHRPGPRRKLLGGRRLCLGRKIRSENLYQRQERCAQPSMVQIFRLRCLLWSDQDRINSCGNYSPEK